MSLADHIGLDLIQDCDMRSTWYEHPNEGIVILEILYFIGDHYGEVKEKVVAMDFFMN